ncbi:MAG: hypothetical protein A2583_10325, partial [Bdellovibrionales bacterium RIFOXYD1_FULL_53_11]
GHFHLFSENYAGFFVAFRLKVRAPEKKQILQTCVAFANGAGGEIIFGVEDESGRIIGVNQVERNRIFEGIGNSIFDSISPTIVPEIFERNVNDRMLVVIKIYPGTKPPYFIKSEGSKKGVYLRVGTNTKRASEEYIEDLYRHQRKSFFDEEPSLLKSTQLCDELLSNVYGQHFSTSRLLADKVLVRDEIKPNILNATNAGVLFFSDTPEKHLPEAIIMCSEFSGRTGRDILRTNELTGPIPALASSALRLIASWIERDPKAGADGRLRGHHLIPETALREAIINALVHRKYFIPGAIKIALYDDHLEVFSPGAFPGPVSVNNVGDGTTFLRNPTIARLARQHKLIEKLGSGVRLIYDLCKKEGLKKPVFNEDGDFVKITFFFEKQADQSLSVEENILQLGHQYKELRISDITTKLGISRNTATRKLNRLLEQGICVRTGKGPSVRFIFKK